MDEWGKVAESEAGDGRGGGGEDGFEEGEVPRGGAAEAELLEVEARAEARGDLDDHRVDLEVSKIYQHEYREPRTFARRKAQYAPAKFGRSSHCTSNGSASRRPGPKTWI